MKMATAWACIATGVLLSPWALAITPVDAPHVVLSFDDGENGVLKATIKVTGMAGWESLHFAAANGSPGGLPGGGGFTDDDPAHDWTFSLNTIELPRTADNQTDSMTFTLLYDKTKVRGLTGDAHALRFTPDDQGEYNDLGSSGGFKVPVNGFSKYEYTSLSAIPEPGTWMLMLAGMGALGVGVRRRISD